MGAIQFVAPMGRSYLPLGKEWFILARFPERWMSGLSRTPGKRVQDNILTGVRIPPSPPNQKSGLAPDFLFGRRGGDEKPPGFDQHTDQWEVCAGRPQGGPEAKPRDGRVASRRA